jgi:hypothetical protein
VKNCRLRNDYYYYCPKEWVGIGWRIGRGRVGDRIGDKGRVRIKKEEDREWRSGGARLECRLGWRPDFP